MPVFPHPVAVRRIHTAPPTKDDLRSLGPLHQCACGGQMFHMLAQFEDGLVSQYLLDGLCASCGSIVQLPTEIDPDPLA